VPLAAVVRHPSTKTGGSVTVTFEASRDGRDVFCVWKEKRCDDEDDDDMANRQVTSSARRLAMTEHCRYIHHVTIGVVWTGCITYLPNERMYTHDAPEGAFYTSRLDPLL
jgi:hypothetical protein